MEIREIKANEVSADLFKGFVRHQVVTRCLRRENGEWVEKDIAFNEEWGYDDFVSLAAEMKEALSDGGRGAALFEGDALVGFAYLLSERFMDYAILFHMHISSPYRGRGLGRLLFNTIKQYAREMGAKRLYISAHSSVESQAFYMKMGCVDAQNLNSRLVELEPCDRQLECPL